MSKNENQQVKSSVSQSGSSVIVAARNEADNILQFIQSFEKQDYPPDLFEVIIVDDNSSDETFNICQLASANFKFLKVYRSQDTGNSGKRSALSYGISKATHTFIMITDADCLPESKWLKSYDQKFSKGYEVLFGSAPFIREDFFVNKISCFENLRSSLFSIAMGRAGLPFTAAARNMGFLKTSFDKIGGYSKTTQTIGGDDDLLIREAVMNKLKIGVVGDEGSSVYSFTKKTFSQYLSQKSRHTQTSFHYLLKHKLILTAWHSLNLFFLFSPILSFTNLNFLILLPVKLLTDLIVVKLRQKKFGYTFKGYEIIYLQIVYELFLIIHLVNAKFRKVKWK